MHICYSKLLILVSSTPTMMQLNRLPADHAMHIRVCPMRPGAVQCPSLTPDMPDIKCAEARNIEEVLTLLDAADTPLQFALTARLKLILPIAALHKQDHPGDKHAGAATTSCTP